MDNKNTFTHKSNIVANHKKNLVIPEVGDEFVFCSSEDEALSEYTNYVGESHELFKGSYLTDFFKKVLVDGELCEPFFVQNERFGFFGCRTQTSNQAQKGHFYLYKMEL